MENRYRIRTSGWDYFCEAPYTQEGLEFLKKLRSEDSSFRNQRIRSVIQAYPSKVELYKITKYT